MKQYGLSSTLIAGAVALLVIGGLLVVQTKRLETAKSDLVVCATHYKEALEAIQKQNEAVSAFKDASEQAKKRAQEAQERAKAAGQGLVKERERLALLAKKPATGPCPAGEAVKRVREGLR